MRTDAEMAEAFYPNTPAPQPAPVPQADPTAADRVFSEQGKPEPGEAEAGEIITLIRGVSPHLPENADQGLVAAITEAVKTTQARRDESRETFLRGLRMEHGWEEADRLVKEARALAGRNPKLKKLLNATGAGDSGPVISRFVSMAQAERKARN